MRIRLLRFGCCVALLGGLLPPTLHAQLSPAARQQIQLRTCRVAFQDANARKRPVYSTGLIVMGDGQEVTVLTSIEEQAVGGQLSLILFGGTARAETVPVLEYRLHPELPFAILKARCTTELAPIPLPPVSSAPPRTAGEIIISSHFDIRGEFSDLAPAAQPYSLVTGKVLGPVTDRGFITYMIRGDFDREHLGAPAYNLRGQFVGMATPNTFANDDLLTICTMPQLGQCLYAHLSSPLLQAISNREGMLKLMASGTPLNPLQQEASISLDWAVVPDGGSVSNLAADAIQSAPVDTRGRGRIDVAGEPGRRVTIAYRSRSSLGHLGSWQQQSFVVSGQPGTSWIGGRPNLTDDISPFGRALSPAERPVVRVATNPAMPHLTMRFPAEQKLVGVAWRGDGSEWVILSDAGMMLAFDDRGAVLQAIHLDTACSFLKGSAEGLLIGDRARLLIQVRDPETLALKRTLPYLEAEVAPAGRLMLTRWPDGQGMKGTFVTMDLQSGTLVRQRSIFADAFGASREWRGRPIASDAILGTDQKMAIDRSGTHLFVSGHSLLHHLKASTNGMSFVASTTMKAPGHWPLFYADMERGLLVYPRNGEVDFINTTSDWMVREKSEYYWSSDYDPQFHALINNDDRGNDVLRIEPPGRETIEIPFERSVASYAEYGDATVSPAGGQVLFGMGNHKGIICWVNYAGLATGDVAGQGPEAAASSVAASPAPALRNAVLKVEQKGNLKCSRLDISAWDHRGAAWSGDYKVLYLLTRNQLTALNIEDLSILAQRSFSENMLQVAWTGAGLILFEGSQQRIQVLDPKRLKMTRHIDTARLNERLATGRRSLVAAAEGGRVLSDRYPVGIINLQNGRFAHVMASFPGVRYGIENGVMPADGRTVFGTGGQRLSRLHLARGTVTGDADQGEVGWGLRIGLSHDEQFVHIDNRIFKVNKLTTPVVDLQDSPDRTVCGISQDSRFFMAYDREHLYLYTMAGTLIKALPCENGHGESEFEIPFANAACTAVLMRDSSTENYRWIEIVR